MGVVIRIALVLAAIAAIILMVSPFVDKIGEGFSAIASGLSSSISYLAPYFLFGRKLINLLTGAPTVVTIMLWFVLLAPFSLHIISFAIKIYKKIVN